MRELPGRNSIGVRAGFVGCETPYPRRLGNGADLLTIRQASVRPHVSMPLERHWRPSGSSHAERSRRSANDLRWLRVSDGWRLTLSIGRMLTPFELFRDSNPGAAWAPDPALGATLGQQKQDTQTAKLSARSAAARAQVGEHPSEVGWPRQPIALSAGAPQLQVGPRVATFRSRRRRCPCPSGRCRDQARCTGRRAALGSRSRDRSARTGCSSACSRPPASGPGRALGPDSLAPRPAAGRRR